MFLFSSDMHPYNCTLDKYCEHCTNATTAWHNANNCWLCCEGNPKKNNPTRYVEENFALRIHVRDRSPRRKKVPIKRYQLFKQTTLLEAS